MVFLIEKAYGTKLNSINNNNNNNINIVHSIDVYFIHKSLAERIKTKIKKRND